MSVCGRPQGRVIVIVLDSLGVGALPDAERFGDDGAHTLDHIVEATGGLEVPHLIAAGLGHVPGVRAVPQVDRPSGAFGRMAEVSPGKDTPTGHWEMMNCPLRTEFPVFPDGFPTEFIDAWISRAGLEGYLENAAASGTEVIERQGPEHLRTGFPIVYTSADSVFQVAAHAESFGLERLYAVCEVAREMLDPLGVGRVIARPFVGREGSFTRTYDRRDYSMPPPADTSLDRLMQAGVPVTGVGKIHDIFSGKGISTDIHTAGNADGMQRTLDLARGAGEGLVFTNLVDFDSHYGHRRDPVGYRAALEEFDSSLGELLGHLRETDLVFLTADHGTDPTHPGVDHTREYVPILALGPGVRAGTELGTRSSFCDLGASIEEAFGLTPTPPGCSFLSELAAP
ncbi:MAG TPA: phosphopentomutase [Planctomycetota bacterium]|nr:phosphopentomutase [Planctomycetota bacterium]